ncbi:MAG: 4-hydroxy-tetrahydrodipicolinate synthase [Bacteroidaceae bacterium]|nr:4-hydroxy-tetrahydrodipicolinate synthase [Bacteroidaceae bacterium]
MERENIFKGVGVALVTPFLENGDIDFEALRSLVDSVIAGGVDFLCVLGTTAETPCLSAAERLLVMETVAETAAARVPLLLGCGGNNTREVVNFLQTADLSAYQGVLIVTPYYNRPSQEGLFCHFESIASVSPLPVVLYNVPGRTGVNLQTETTIRIANACQNVVAIKEASGNLEQIGEILRLAPDGFEVLSGDDALTLNMVAMGAVGVISVVGNACPSEYTSLVHAALQADNERAQLWQSRLGNLYKLLMVDGNPSGVKALLAEQKKIKNILRLPLVPARVETQDLIRKELSLLTSL